MMKKTLVALAAVAVTGGAFAQSVLTGEIAYGFSSVNANNVTTSGFGLDAADVTFATSEDVEGLGKLSVSLNWDGSGGRNASLTAGDQSVTLVTAGGMTLFAGSVKGASYLGQGIASAGSSYDDNLSGKNISSRTSNDVLSAKMTLTDTLTLSVSHTEADVALGTGSALAVGATTQRYNTASLTFKAGQLSADGGYRSYDNQIANSTSSANTQSRASVGYDLGVAKIGAGMTTTTYMYGNTSTQSLLGVNVPLGALKVGGQYGQNVTSGNATSTSNYTRTGMILGSQYDFSKRTYLVGHWYSYDAGNSINTTGYYFALYNTF
jgi:hypothetical protein